MMRKCVNDFGIVRSCIRRGRRGQCYSLGIMFDQFDEEVTANERDLILSLQEDSHIDDATRAGLVRDFNVGVASYKLHLVVKFSHWQHEQYLFYRLAMASNRFVVENALRAILAMSSAHPQVLETKNKDIK